MTIAVNKKNAVKKGEKENAEPSHNKKQNTPKRKKGGGRLPWTTDISKETPGPSGVERE